MKIADALKGRGKPSIAKIIKLLESLPKDEVFKTSEIRDRAPRLDKHNSTPELEGYSVIDGGIKFWGRKSAIAEFKKAVEKRDRENQ